MMTTTDSRDIAATDNRDGRLPATDDFVYDVDGATYHSRGRWISGAEIMAAAGISVSDGLVRLYPDGTTATIDPDEEVELVPETKYRRRPRFKRG